MAQAAPNAPSPPAPPVVSAELPKPRMVPVKLARHYHPKDVYEVVGHWTDLIEVKNAKTGKMEVLQAPELVRDEPKPPPIAGVGSASLKLWAGTIVRLPIDEAKRARDLGIGTIEIDD